ncbi:MAG: NUDIX hydrolase [Pseudomonadota bacterium]
MSGSSIDPDFHRAVPPDDTIERDICTHCGFVSYQNPKIVVGSVVRTGDGILMCKRAIEPRKGFWTLPAGYLEKNETPEEGARREAMEEACATINLSELLAVYTIVRLSQVQLIYRSTLQGSFDVGPESEAVETYSFDRIPWDEIAFPSVHWALHHDESVHRGIGTAPFKNPDGQTGAFR